MAPERRVCASGRGASLAWPELCRTSVMADGWSGGWLEADLGAEGFESRDQAAGFSFWAEAAGEEVGGERPRGAKPSRRRRAACAAILIHPEAARRALSRSLGLSG